MYIGIDIGGTKTLVAALTNAGVIAEQLRFETPRTYDSFLAELRKTVVSLTTRDFRAGTVAVPGAIDRQHGVARQFGNRPTWKNLPILRDIESITVCPMRIENDAKLGGLSEAMLLKKQYKRVLYITLSTGIGIGLTVDGVIDAHIGDGGGRAMLLSHNGKLVPWETFASGSAIVKTYGKMASEINDKATWQKIARNLTPGILELIAVLNPEVIVIGGGAGHYLQKFHAPLLADLRQYETPLLVIPPIVPAQRPDHAVIYGCYDYARQKYA
jgi:predicted NBD/HSP70 family sugar kinase